MNLNPRHTALLDEVRAHGPQTIEALSERFGVTLANPSTGVQISKGSAEGVILNDDPQAHLAHLKPMPAAHPLTDRCIECGCCVAACGTARMREDFVGAVGMNRVARQRAVNKALGDLPGQRVHALAIKATAPGE